MSIELEQYEVTPPAGSFEAPRRYTIETLVVETGFSVQIRRLGNDQVIWRCATRFETAEATRAYQGSALEKIIELVKYDLAQGFIK